MVTWLPVTLAPSKTVSAHFYLLLLGLFILFVYILHFPFFDPAE